MYLNVCGATLVAEGFLPVTWQGQVGYFFYYILQVFSVIVSLFCSTENLYDIHHTLQMIISVNTMITESWKFFPQQKHQRHI